MTNSSLQGKAVEGIAASLKRPDKALVLSLPNVSGDCVVGGLRGVSFSVVKRLRAFGLLDERWTWASGATPDVGLTTLGLAVQDLLKRTKANPS